MATMQEIEPKAKAYAQARQQLVNVLTLLNAEIDAVKRKRMARLRKAIEEARNTGDSLLALVADSEDQFTRPKSQILHGIRLGFKKEKGKIKFADEDHVIKLIHKHLPELADDLIITTEKPSKEAINKLDVAQLKKIGATVTCDSDVAFISDPFSEVDKLVSALLKGAEDEEVAA